MAKVFVHYEEGVDEALHTTLKITLPKKWMNGPISKILKTFIDTCVHPAPPTLPRAAQLTPSPRFPPVR